MKRITGIGIVACMPPHYLLPVYATDNIQMEFERFLSFIYEHPQGGTFEMQDDMTINADIITSEEITTCTNDYQVRIEHNIDGDSNVSTDNLDNDVTWEFVDREKTLTIESSGKNRPLVYMNAGINAFSLRAYSTEGTALETADGEELYAEYTGKENYISAENENAVGILNKNSYWEHYYSASMVDVDVYINGDNSIDMLTGWLQIEYSRIKINDTDSKAIQILDGYYIGNKVIIVEDNQPPEETWKPDTSMPAREITALQSHMVDDLLLSKQVEVVAVLETGKEKSFQTSLWYGTTAYERGMQIYKPFHLYGIADESGRRRIDTTEHAFPFYIIPDGKPVFDMSLYMVHSDTDYYSYFPRACNAKAVHLYTNTDKTHWKFQHNSIHSVSQYAPGSIVLLPYTAVCILQVTKPFTYTKVEIIDRYYGGRSYVLRVHDITRNPIPDASNQNKNDGGGEGNDGQDGGRGESPYVPDTPNDKDETMPWTIEQGALQINEAVKKEQRKKEKVIRMEKHEGRPDTIQTTAQADYADTEQLYTGRNKDTDSSQIKQSQNAVLWGFLTLNPVALKDMIIGEQYETISRSGNIIGEIWESSAPFLRILQRLFQ